MQRIDKQRTRLLREAIESEYIIESSPESVTGPQFPRVFLEALRESLIVGWSCDQLTSFLILITGLHETIASFDGEELVERSNYILQTMKGDLESLQRQREWLEGMIQKKKKELRKRKK